MNPCCCSCTSLPLNSSLPLKWSRSLKMKKCYSPRRQLLALRKSLRKSGYREGRKASAAAQPLTDGQTDTIYPVSELQVPRSSGPPELVAKPSKATSSASSGVESLDLSRSARPCGALALLSTRTWLRCFHAQRQRFRRAQSTWRIVG